MEIVLLQDIKKVGKRGEIKKVSDGFARNFLFPNKLAEPANKFNVAKAKAVKEKFDQMNAAELANKKNLANKLNNEEITINAKSEKEKLFGAITKKQIIQALAKKKIVIDESAIVMDKSIKELGEFLIKIDLEKNIQATIKVNVKSE